jgi:peptide/nickel transport system substrate-binding protein
MLTRRAMIAATATAPFLDYAAVTQAWAATPKQVVVMVKQIDDIISFDPAESYEFTDNEVDGNCYRKLVAPDLTTGTGLIGDLAEKWDVSSDGLTFTFHLRGDAYFPSGKPVTAQDAEFSLHRIVLLNKTPGFIITQFGFSKDNVAKLIQAKDARTLEMKLPSAQATTFVLYCLSANVGGIVEKATAMAHQTAGDMGNSWLKTHTAGAGAYSLTSWAASDHVIIDANPHSGIKTGARRVVIRHVKDPAAQLLLLEKGDADIARDLQADQLKTIKGNPAYHLATAKQGTSMYIGMNQGNAALAKPQVHQAIKSAINYDAIATNITPTTWTVDQSFLPEGLPGALTEQPFKKDTAKAKKLLADAGYANGLSLTMDYISASPYSEIAQAVQQDLAEAGIKLQLLPGEQKQVFSKMRARQHQLILSIWGTDYFDPNSNAQAFCANPDDSDTSKLKILAWRCHFADKQLTEEAADAAKELDAKKRVALYQEMQRQFWQRAPFAMLLQKNEVAVLRKGVTGLKLGPMPDYTKYAAIEKA